ncbi:phosphoribosyltransferase domain-containing protein [Thiofilum flexile]|uniref:phosphoribosyltransferase domain-containing protein n=2 Tax=Thiofilum flexile TaxID=125627 RepID=UPI00036AD485|nr:phosphoribosyltransferase domain-containing protein [Thiofilum flexile]
MQIETQQVELTTGTLTLHIASQHSTYTPYDLFGFAERRNPKRSFLFVSKVLGRHIPVAPSLMRRATDTLAQLIPDDLPTPLLVIGMAETAIALGAGVHQALSRRYPDSLYLCTTRHPLAQPLLVEFKEEHSHATQQVLHYPHTPEHQTLLTQAKTLVLVDDEASTGKTFANLVEALKGKGLESFERIIIVTLTDWSGDQAAQSLGSNVQSIALLKGHWDWQGNGQPAPEMPAVDVLGTGAWLAKAENDWARLGVSTHRLPTIAASITVQPQEKILVLGTGEFVWPSFLLAEYLEQQGATVKFSATTRSPIALGHSIQTRYCIHDNYGQGIANFLYNVSPEHYDRILLCTETPQHLLDQSLIKALNAEVVEFYP